MNRAPIAVHGIYHSSPVNKGFGVSDSLMVRGKLDSLGLASGFKSHSGKITSGIKDMLFKLLKGHHWYNPSVC